MYSALSLLNVLFLDNHIQITSMKASLMKIYLFVKSGENITNEMAELERYMHLQHFSERANIQ